MNRDSPDNPFRLGGRYRNRKGYFTVISLDGDTLRIRWDTGEEVNDTIESQARILHNMERDAAGKPQRHTKSKKRIPPPSSFAVTTRARQNPVFAQASTAIQQCFHCHRDLSKHPIITIGERAFCYRCAKTEYPKLMDQARLARGQEERRTAPARKEYKVALDAFKQKEQQYEAMRKASANIGFYTEGNMWIVALAITIPCGIIIPVLGLLVVFPVVLALQPIWDREREKHYKVFDINHTRPVFDRVEPSWNYFPDPSISLHPDCSASNLVDIGYNRMSILRRDDFTCQSCGVLFQPTQLEVHHVLPRAQGGSDSVRNLTSLCKRCHFKEDWFDHVHKQNRELIEERRRKELNFRLGIYPRQRR